MHNLRETSIKQITLLENGHVSEEVAQSAFDISELVAKHIRDSDLSVKEMVRSLRLSGMIVLQLVETFENEVQS